MGEGGGVFFNLQGPRELFSSLQVTSDTQRFGGQDFDLLYQQLAMLIRPSAWLGVRLFTTLGEWIDFVEARPADQMRFRLVLDLALGRHLEAQLAYIYSSLDVAGGRLFVARAPELRAIYHFNRRAFVRVIAQYTEVENNPGLFSFPVESLTQDLSTQLLFSYEVGPQTAFFVGYSDGSFGTDQMSLTRTDRAFFVKLGYAWLP